MANKLETILENAGKIFTDAFKETDKVAVKAEPFVDIAFPALATVYNAAANGAAAAIAAATPVVDATKSETDNLIAVTLAVEPVLVKYAASAGLTVPTTAQVLQYAAALVIKLAQKL